MKHLKNVALAAATLGLVLGTMPATAGDTTLETSLIKQVSKADLVKYLKGITAFDRTGGMGGDKQAAYYIKQQLDAQGIPNEMYHWKGYVSIPGAATLTIEDGKTSRKVPAKTFSFAVSTPPGGIDGELVFIDYNMNLLDSLDKPLVFDWKKLKGKIALVSGIPVPTIVDQIQAAGAIGAVFTSTNPVGINEFIVTNIWGTPATDTAPMLPTMSSVNISQADSKALEEATKHGTVRVRYEAKVDTGWRDLYLPVATIKGQSDDYVLMGSHLCSWYIGATDNAAANATGLELASLFYKNRNKLRRSVKIAWWPAHSQGRYAGSAWFADHAWRDMDRNAIATLNGDLWGMKGSTEYSTVNAGELTPFINKLMTDTTGSTKEILKPNRHSDESFLGIGVPGTLLRHTIKGEERPWYWHSEPDTIDKVDPDIMVEEAGMAVRFMVRLIEPVAPPIRFGGVGHRIEQQVNDYSDKAGDLFEMDDVNQAAKAFTAAAEAADRALEAGTPEARSAAVTADLKAVSRTLDPVLYTVQGRFHPDDAYPKAYIPGLIDTINLKTMDTNARGFAQFYLVRERTRLIDALEQATVILQRIAAQAGPAA